MGVVFLATHMALDKRVALKVIAEELAEDEGFRERFRREPKLAASIDHPNVIPVFDAGEDDDQLSLRCATSRGRTCDRDRQRGTYQT